MLIYARFKDGREALYSGAVLPLMLSDPDVSEIMDAETGEIYKASYPNLKGGHENE